MTEKYEIKQEATPRDFINVIFKRKWIILATVAFATITVFYLNARRPEFYESYSRILVKRGEQSNLFTGHVRYLSWEEEVSSQIEVILSEVVFEDAERVFADSLLTAGHPEQWRFHRGFIRADVMGESNVFIIACSDLNPRIAKLGCIAMTHAFQNYYEARKAPPALSDYFAVEIADVQGDIEHWETKRNAFLNEHMFFGMDDEGNHLLRQISLINDQLVETESDITVQEKRVTTLNELARKSGDILENELAIRLTRGYIQTTIIENIKTELQKCRLKREELLGKYTKKHPSIIAVDTQINDLHFDLEREIRNSSLIENQELQGLQAKKESLNGELAKVRKKLELLPDKDMELNKFDTVISNLRIKYELLLKKQSETDIALLVQTEWEITVLSSASAPYSKKTSDYLRLALGPFLSIIVALGIVFFLESMDHSVKNSAEVEEYLRTSVLATISEVKKQ